MVLNIISVISQGRMQDFKLGGGAYLQKLRRAEGGAKNVWGVSCEKSRFYAKKSYFFLFLGGSAGIHPCIVPSMLLVEETGVQ